MIRINLLPEEYRRSERTSPKLFASVLLGVMMVCCSFGWFGYVYFGELDQMEVEHARVTERLNSLKKRVQYHDQLAKERTDYRQRARTIAQISKSRVLWTKIIDQLVDVVNNEGDTSRHQAWFRSLAVKDGNGKEGPEVRMPGWVEGNEFRSLADFHEDVEAAPFSPYVRQKSMPTGVENTNPTRTPDKSLFFNLVLSFKTVAKWNEANKAPAKPAGK